MMADTSLPDLATVDRMLAMDVAYTVSRMRVLERIPGNPVGIAFQEIDATAIALMSRYLQAFNRLVGLRAGHEDKLEMIAGWYRQHSVRPTFEMVPGISRRTWAANWRAWASSSRAFTPR